MTTTEATNVAVRLIPGHTVICNERYQSTQHGDRRTEGLECHISVHPALTGTAPCQQFHGPSFEHCLQQLAGACGSPGTEPSPQKAAQPGSSIAPAPGVEVLAAASLIASSIS